MSGLREYATPTHTHLHHCLTPPSMTALVPANRIQWHSNTNIISHGNGAPPRDLCLPQQREVLKVIGSPFGLLNHLHINLHEGTTDTGTGERQQCCSCHQLTNTSAHALQIEALTPSTSAHGLVQHASCPLSPLPSTTVGSGTTVQQLHLYYFIIVIITVLYYTCIFYTDSHILYLIPIPVSVLLEVGMVLASPSL